MNFTFTPEATAAAASTATASARGLLPSICSLSLACPDQKGTVRSYPRAPKNCRMRHNQVVGRALDLRPRQRPRWAQTAVAKLLPFRPSRFPTFANTYRGAGSPEFAITIHHSSRWVSRWVEVASVCSRGGEGGRTDLHTHPQLRVFDEQLVDVVRG
jgi:hypothetical protein